MKFEAQTILQTVLDLASNVRSSEDASVPAIAEAVEGLDAAKASWVATVGGASPSNSAAVLGAADTLLDALHAENPEGLPWPYKDDAAVMLTVLDLAEENGIAIERAAHAPVP